MVLTNVQQSSKCNNGNRDILAAYLLLVKEEVHIFPSSNLADICPEKVQECEDSEPDDMSPNWLFDRQNSKGFYDQ
jgi:hypothetical protein